MRSSHRLFRNRERAREVFKTACTLTMSRSITEKVCTEIEVMIFRAEDVF